MKNKKTMITIIALAFMFGLKLVPPITGLTTLGMNIAGIFIGTILLWLYVSTTWPSVLCMVALMLTPLYTYSQVLSGSMGNWITSFVLFSSMVTYALGQTGYLRRLAVWFITRPFAKKNPWAFLGLFFLAPLVIGSFMSPIPTFMIFIPIAEQIFKELGYEKGDRLPQMITLSVLCFASISTITTPIAHTVPLLSMSLFQKDMKTGIDFLSYSAFGVVSALVMYALILLFLKYVFRPDLSKLQNLDIDKLSAGMAPMSVEEKTTLSVFAFVVALWMAPGILKYSMPALATFINNLGTPAPAMIGVVLLSLIKIKGKALMKFDEAMSKGVSWAAVMLVAATMILSSALVDEKVGITAYMVKLISPLIGNLPPMVFVLIVALCTVVMTNFASNTVTVTLIYSIAMPLVLKSAIVGVNPAALTCVIGAGACVAMATPPSTAHAAIAAGTGWLNTDVMFKYGMPISLIGALVLTFVGYPIAAALM